MSTYVIGDLQGCFLSLQSLLQKIRFSVEKDRLWFVGDLVNRGPDSLQCLRFIKMLGSRATTVLGNHDLHLLAVSEGIRPLHANDTLQPILDAHDRVELLNWLRGQKMLHLKNGYAMVHAGLLPEWSWNDAQSHAIEIESALRGAGYRPMLENMYGAKPDHWQPELLGHAKQRAIINAMTRMRILTDDNRMQLKFKGDLSEIPAHHKPWFKALSVRTTDKPEYTIIAGHWSALGLYVSPHFIGVDSGCLWGRKLTALRLEDRAVFQVPCAEKLVPTGFD